MTGKIFHYILCEKLYEKGSTVIYRGYKENDNKTCIIKILNINFSSLPEISKFKQEYDIIRKIAVSGVVKVYDIIEYDHKLALILEDFNGIPLEKFINRQQPDLKTSLKIAIKIAETLGSLHRKNLIHKAISPLNILYNPDTEELKLTDFGITNELIHERQTLYNPEMIEDTLAYVSPEQTGRINCPLDYRTDMYSLGITLYKLLTGIVPFLSSDPLEIIHHHIAVNFSSPADCSPEIPPPVSAIVMKLLAKIPDDRYQSCFGLINDLQKCLLQLENEETIADFKLGEKDIAPLFIIPRILVGREEQLEFILDTVKKISSEREKKAVLLVSGSAGIGKSALIDEAFRIAPVRKGYFISGKYDQFSKEVPYSGIIQAFQALVSQILSENNENVKKWKEVLLEVLGPNGKVITDVIPEIELIIGEQPGMPELPSEQNQNRFNYVFGNFVRVLATRQHPVVLFLEDLQWADTASFNLLYLIMTDKDIGHFLVVGTYRDNEITQAHPLLHMLETIKQAALPIYTQQLNELNVEHVNKMLIHFLRYTTKETLPLAVLVHQKTNGNPLFVNQFIKTLYDENLLKLDPLTGWNWELNQLDQLQITANVAELLVNKISKLPLATQEVLKACACMGNRFEPKLLSRLLNQSAEDFEKELALALNKGILKADNNSYQFQHDRIYEAVYSLIPPGVKEKIHYQLGKLMLETTSPEHVQDKIMYIVDQLNGGKGLLSSDEEKTELAGLNLQAGNKAKASTAYQSALAYFKNGIEQLTTLQPPETLLEASDSFCWKKQYTLALSLYTNAAEAAYLTSDYDETERLANEVVKYAASPVDKAKAYEIKIHMYMAQIKLHEVIETGLNTLQLLGIKIPHNPNLFHLVLGLAKINLLMLGKQARHLFDLPRIDDPLLHCVLELLASISSTAYLTRPKLLPLIVLKSLELIINNGNAVQSPYIFCGYGLFLCATGKLDKGYEFGKLGLRLLESLDCKEELPRTQVVMSNFIRHWKEPLRETIQPVLDGLQLGLELGDWEFVANSAIICILYKYFSGNRLKEVEQDINKYGALVHKIKQEPQYYLISLYEQIVCNLQKSDEHHPWQLHGDFYNEELMLPVHQRTNDRNAVAALHIHKLMLCYLFNEYEPALENIKNAENYLDAQVALYGLSLFYFYDSLVHLELYKISKEQKTLRRIKRNRKKLKNWMVHNPANQANKYYLIEAEYMHVLGKNHEAIALYNKSLASARENGFIQEEGMANECAARFWFKIQQVDYARVHLQAAYDCYSRWGARAKLHQLEKEYGQYFHRAGSNSSTAEHGLPEWNEPGVKNTQPLDLSTVMKAAQTISEEIVLEKLLEKMLRILIENAGAQKGFLIIENEADSKLYIEAEGSTTEEIKVLESIPLESSTNLSLAVVNYVKKSKKSVIINNATENTPFASDPYLENNRPKSILCGPLTHKGRVSGIIYLENNLINHAFTPKRLELLNLLSVQIAISIENARFYEKLEEKVRERTRQLNEANKKLKELALIDPLTKLKNRRYVSEIISHLAADFMESQARMLKNTEARDTNKKSKIFGIYLIDLDHFKFINDNYGHRVGDQLLIKLSDTLTKMVRNDDVIVRWGGEEFLIILLDTKPEYLKIFAKKLLTTVKETSIVLPDNKIITRTCSVGFTRLPIDNQYPQLLNLEQIINICDYALYLAKEKGRNQAVHIRLKKQESLDEVMRSYLINLSRKSKIKNTYIDIQYLYPL